MTVMHNQIQTIIILEQKRLPTMKMHIKQSQTVRTRTQQGVRFSNEYIN